MRGKDGRSGPVHQGVGRRVLFTGPDGVGNHRVKLCDFPHSIGIGALALEATGDLNYLFRAAPNTPSPLPKNCYVGGVGWGIEHGFSLNARTLLSNTQIKRSEFRSAMEDRISQIFQHPWQAPPCRQELRTQVHQSADKKQRRDSNNQILLSKPCNRLATCSGYNPASRMKSAGIGFNFPHDKDGQGKQQRKPTRVTSGCRP